MQVEAIVMSSATSYVKRWKVNNQKAEYLCIRTRSSEKAQMYRENEAVAFFKYQAQEIQPFPHHLQIPRSQKPLLLRKIHILSHKCKAVGMDLNTSFVCLPVKRHYNKVPQK
jgi:hypothetical protein